MRIPKARAGQVVYMAAYPTASPLEAEDVLLLGAGVNYSRLPIP